MLKYMDYAYAVYKEKSFTKAAEKLYISQPSLSLTIKKLEKELGYPIFERYGKEITLTHIGEKYIKAIEEIISIKTNLENEIDDLLKLNKGNIIIGCTTFISSYILPDILKAFKEKYPDINISIIVEQSTVLEENLEKGLVDIVIDNKTSLNAGYEYIPLLKERILIGVPNDFAVNKLYKNFQIPLSTIKSTSCNYSLLPKISISKFKDESFILLKYGNKMRRIANRIFDENNIIPNICLEFDLLMTAVSYADKGFGILFLTDTILKYANMCKNLTFYLPDTEFAERNLYIIYKKSKYLSSAANEFIGFLKSNVI